MNHQRTISLLSLASLLLVTCGGCYSTITAHEVTDDPKAEGLRYFLPAPYLIVEESSGNRWDARLELAVDRSREYAVQPRTYFATSNAEVSFNSDGTLKSFKLTQDSTTVPEAMINALKDIGTKTLDLQQSTTSPPPKGQGGAGKGAKASAEQASLHAYVFRIDGEQLIPVAPACISVTGTTTGPQALDAPKGAAPQVQLDQGAQVYRLKGPAGGALAQDDIDRLVFYSFSGSKNQPLPASDNQLLRSAATIQDGAIVIPVAQVQQKRVAAVSLGTDGTPVNLPTP